MAENQKLKLLVNGAGGRMGGEVRKLIDERGEELGVVYAGGTDPQGAGGCPKLGESDFDADVAVDFSFHTCIGEFLSYAEKKKLPVVIATTGHTEEEVALIRAAAEKIPVFYASNLSVGVALLVEFAKKAAAAFPDADIEIVETHHNRKMDVPSGTAMTLAKAAAGAREGSEIVIGRTDWGRRKPREVTVHALRMGNIAGVHELHITTDHEQLTLKHEAYDRVLFAEGAMSASRWIAAQKAGLYGMEDMLNG